MSEGKKHDQDKLRFDLILPEFEQAMAEVLTHGAEKYGDNNWKLVEGAKARYTAALKRHLNEWQRGYVYDTDSSCRVLAQVAVNAMFLDWLDRNPKLMKLKQELSDADKVLSAGIDHRVLAATTGTKQDPPCGSSVDTASESQFDPYRYE